MKRLAIICTVVGLIIALSVPALADGLGAVKTALRERTDPQDRYGSGPEVGWVIANTDAEGLLIVNAHLDAGEPDTSFTVWVVINGMWMEEDLGELATNAMGKGNANLKLELAKYVPEAYGEDTIDVRVVVDNWYPGDTPTPYIGYATSEVKVSLK